MISSSESMVIEMDGSMVPTVEYGASDDRRKTKITQWEELRIGLAQNQGELTKRYAVSFESADQLGDRMKEGALSLGMTTETRVHGVGGGARWIVEQGERIAGSNFTYLIDLPHLCEYFASAAEGWGHPDKLTRRLKRHILKGKYSTVMSRLKKELKKRPEHKGLISCIRYLENCPKQFDYPGAIRKELPIGSGEIESAHRYLIQRRLKLPGSWWLRSNAAAIADLRIFNGGWQALWEAQEPNWRLAA